MKKIYLLGLLMLGMLSLASCNDGKDELTDSRLTYYAELTMEGDEFMIVPVGTEFVDPGCKAQIYDKAQIHLQKMMMEEFFVKVVLQQQENVVII